jgi:hypothetical protein
VAPFGLVTGRAPVALLAMKFLEVLVLEEKELGLAEAWKVENLVRG